MSTPATVVSTKSSIEITATTPAASKPFNFAGLSGDIQGKIAELAGTPALAGYNKRVSYHGEYLRCRSLQTTNPLIAGKIKTNWIPDQRGKCAAEINQTKRDMARWIQQHAGIFNSLYWEQIVKLDPNINPENATIDDLNQVQQAICKRQDEVWTNVFNLFTIYNNSPLDEHDKDKTFQKSLENLPLAEKATKIREWVKQLMTVGKLNLSAAWLENWASGDRWIPLEFFDIPMDAQMRKNLFITAAKSGSFDFVKRMIESDHFRNLSADDLFLAFAGACRWGDSGIVSLFMNCGRYSEILKSNHFGHAIQSAIQHPQLAAKLFNHLPLDCLKNQILFWDSYSERTIHGGPDMAKIIPILSPKKLEELFYLLCSNTTHPQLRKFLVSLLNHPRIAELKTSAVAKGLFLSLGVETVLRAGAAAGAVYLAVQPDSLSNPAACPAISALALGAVTGLKGKVTSLWQNARALWYGTASVWQSPKSLRQNLKEEAIVIFGIAYLLKKGQPADLRGLMS